jgi:hypothetical protein
MSNVVFNSRIQYLGARYVYSKHLYVHLVIKQSLNILQQRLH